MTHQRNQLRKIPVPVPSHDSYLFPSNFLFGSAAAAYQIEGAHDAGGKGPSVWDVYCRTPGNLRTADTGEVACDFYHRYREDIKMMADMGLQAFRLSVSWPRVLPEGRGRVNEAGLAFYDRVIDCLLEHKITPFVTLFHWDTPQALEDLYGSWASRRIVEDFADYAGILAKRLGDRVTNWMTLNEVAAFTEWGFWSGKEKSAFINAPGTRLESRKAVATTAFHAMLAHGAAVQALRTGSPRPCKISFAHNEGMMVPVTESPADIEAARRAFRMQCGPLKLWAAVRGELPGEWVEDQQRQGILPDMTEADLRAIGQPLDALGFNVYSGQYIRAADNAAGYEGLPFTEGYPSFGFDWLNLLPEALYWQARHTREVLGWQGEMFFSENGACGPDKVTDRGEILDVDRLLYLRQALKSVHRLVDEGYPVTAYFLWAIMDNFEWLHGYSKRLGIVHVDYATQKRTPKLSAKWYAEVIRQRRVV